MVNTEIPSAEEAIRGLKERGHTPTGLVVVGGNGSESKTTTSFSTSIFGKTVMPKINWDEIVPKIIPPERYNEADINYVNTYASLLKGAIQNSECFAKTVEVLSLVSRYGGLENIVRSLNKPLKEGKFPPENQIFNSLRFNGLIPLGCEIRFLESESEEEERVVKEHYIYGLPYINPNGQPIEIEELVSKIDGNMVNALGMLKQQGISQPLITFILLNERENSHLNKSIFGPAKPPVILPQDNETKEQRRARKEYIFARFRQENPVDYHLENNPIQLDIEEHVSSFRKEYSLRYRRAIIGEIEEQDDGISVADQALTRAIKEKASDIHIDPVFDPHRGVSYNIIIRKDGKRKGIFRDLPPQQGNKAINALVQTTDRAVRKIGVPFGGNVNCKGFGRSKTMLRLSILPAGTYYNNQTQREEPVETLVARVSEMQAESQKLNQLGLPRYVVVALEKAAKQIDGVNLIIGPTGQGKTTTLAAILQEIANVVDPVTGVPEDRIIAVENPTERRLKGVEHIEENPEAGNTIEKIARELVRQDPDVIMIGEIRDRPTYQIVGDMAVTGHQTWSTLHASTDTQVPDRLFGLIGDPEVAGKYNKIIAENLRLLLSQKLVPKLCEHCREEYDGRSKLASILNCSEAEIEKQLPEKIPFYKSTGRTKTNEICNDCGGDGTNGRIVVPQLLPITPEIRELLYAGNTKEINYLLKGRKAGLLTFPELGIIYALSGYVSLKEMHTYIASPEAIFLGNEAIKNKDGNILVPSGEIINVVKHWQKNKDWFTREANPFIRD